MFNSLIIILLIPLLANATIFGGPRIHKSCRINGWSDKIMDALFEVEAFSGKAMEAVQAGLDGTLTEPFKTAAFNMFNTLFGSDNREVRLQNANTLLRKRLW